MCFAAFFSVFYRDGSHITFPILHVNPKVKSINKLIWPILNPKIETRYQPLAILYHCLMPTSTKQIFYNKWSFEFFERQKFCKGIFLFKNWNLSVLLYSVITQFQVPICGNIHSHIMTFRLIPIWLVQPADKNTDFPKELKTFLQSDICNLERLFWCS